MQSNLRAGARLNTPPKPSERLNQTRWLRNNPGLGGWRLARGRMTWFPWLFPLLAGLAVLCIGGPAVRAQVVLSSGVSTQRKTVAASEEQNHTTALESRSSRYQLQSDDVLAISFPLSPEFDQSVTVQPDGYISLLGAGDLYVRGLTVPRLVTALHDAYAKTLNHPIINVDLKDFQRPFYVVSGQVAKPGQFVLRYETTVSEALAFAGGLTPAAKSQVFLFHRASVGWFKVKPLNFRDIIAGKHVEDTILQPGDMVYVPEKFITRFRTYVPYSIGAYASPQLVF